MARLQTIEQTEKFRLLDYLYFRFCRGRPFKLPLTMISTAMFRCHISLRHPYQATASFLPVFQKRCHYEPVRRLTRNPFPFTQSGFQRCAIIRMRIFGLCPGRPCSLGPSGKRAVMIFDWTNPLTFVIFQRHCCQPLALPVHTLHTVPRPLPAHPRQHQNCRCGWI